MDDDDDIEDEDSSDVRFDLTFRPATYWPDLPTGETLVSKIKGTSRRDVARRALAGEELPRLAPGDDELYRGAMEIILSDSLDDDTRAKFGSIHPSLMGGEYLPDRGEDEVEIARIEFASTTGDVTQILARQDSGRIRYRIVDEYMDEYTEEGGGYVFTPEQSDTPLSFRELIELIDTARKPPEHCYGDDLRDVNLALGPLYANLEDGASGSELEGFVTVTSAFYPRLGWYYDAEADRVLAPYLYDEEEEEEADEEA